MRSVGSWVAVLFVMSTVAAPAGAVTFLQENFNGEFPPAGWTVVDWVGSGVVWTDIPGSLELFNYTGGSGDAASVSSALFPGEFGDFRTLLVSPPITLFGAPGPYYLHFLANYQDLNPNAISDRLWIQYTTDGGAFWDDLVPDWTSDHGAFQAQPGVCVDLDISTLIDDESTVQFRFDYDAGGASALGWYAQIDNVIFDNLPTAPCPLFTDGFEFQNAWSSTPPLRATWRHRGDHPREDLDRRMRRRLEARGADSDRAPQGGRRAMKRRAAESPPAVPELPPSSSRSAPPAP